MIFIKVLVFSVCGQNNNRNLEKVSRSTSLSLVFNKDFSPKCSATIISPLWAIASYSCMIGRQRSVPRKAHNEDEWILFAGDNIFPNKSSQGSDSSAQISKVKNIYEYPQVIK